MVALTLLSGCASKPAAPAARVGIVYAVTGSARAADITIQTPTGSSQQNDVGVPLVSKAGSEGLEFSFASGAFVYLSAQNQGGGEITCEIRTKEGRVISRNTAQGEFAIATCSGSAP